MFPESAYWTDLSGILDAIGCATLAGRLFPQVFRRDFSAPGFALVRLGPAVGSTDLRRLMLNLKAELDRLFHRLTGRRLVHRSLARFDQQETTKFHLDGAADESFLMLGYEPSAVRAELAIADYTKAAFDHGVEPRRFLHEFNPMFARGERLLAPYVTRLTPFDPSAAQLLLVNNSTLPFREDRSNQLGVMHQATIPEKVPGASRVVNSTMIETAAEPDDGPEARAAAETFVTTQAVAGRVYG